jgi:ABC-type cobalt transport system substrate-binding protein
VSQKTREKSVKKHPLFEPQSGEFGGFSFLNASFLSEAGVVLIFGHFSSRKSARKKTQRRKRL